ncbi:GNAT family N-acetyltransferase [Bacillaceae bacterium Marseille-Q3522]|nr:GNAT family N-acetyltransferase [Bacillaceae bacterium Marseille-Q3522]
MGKYEEKKPSRQQQKLSKQQTLYNTVKFVSGENFITIEDTALLETENMVELLRFLMQDPQIKAAPNLSILVNEKFPKQVGSFLLNNGFRFTDERINVYKKLSTVSYEKTDFRFQSLNSLKKEEFVRIWEKSMQNTLNPSSALNMEELMNSVQKELGANYKDSCVVAFEGENPIGVVMPHMEPGTREEGRLFYFGIIPAERNKGKSRELHYQALWMLKNYFKASYYIGSTSSKNIPMLKTFLRNGCVIKERNKVYRRNQVV